MTLDAIRLIPAALRYTAADVIRFRRRFASAVLITLAVAQAAAAPRFQDGAEEFSAFGPMFLLALWFISAPLCRSWVDEDVRFGYGALWLQKPLRPADLYLSRLVALVAWASIATLSVAVTSLPAVVIGSVPLSEFGATIVSFGWIPILLVVLSFTGSAAGARSGGLFAYAMLFGGFAFDGFRSALPLGALEGALRRLFPPGQLSVDIGRSLQDGRVGDALAQMAPLAAYATICAAVGLVLAQRIPARLGGGR
ncbi:MAG: hypothetical protein V3U63_08420 [Gemmatimonadota bacterium]